MRSRAAPPPPRQLAAATTRSSTKPPTAPSPPSAMIRRLWSTSAPPPEHPAPLRAAASGAPTPAPGRRFRSTHPRSGLPPPEPPLPLRAAAPGAPPPFRVSLQPKHHRATRRLPHPFGVLQSSPPPEQPRAFTASGSLLRPLPSWDQNRQAKARRPRAASGAAAPPRGAAPEAPATRRPPSWADQSNLGVVATSGGSASTFGQPPKAPRGTGSDPSTSGGPLGVVAFTSGRKLRRLATSGAPGTFAPSGAAYNLLLLLTEIHSFVFGGSTAGQRSGGKGLKHPTSEHKHERAQQPTWLLVLEIATGVLLLVFVITGAITASRSCMLKPSIRISSWNRSKSWSDEITVLIDSDMLKSLPKLSRQELEVACEDFSNIIGSSPDTVVYKGIMKDGPEVSVISLCAFEGHWTSHHELFYQNKVIDLARLNHENIAKFLGYCRESDPFSRMLVFEYASNGTLYEHLHYGEGAQLSWLRRMKIAIGIAQGLRYLHTELQPPFAISELNSNSVYVTEDFTPKLVDFECWKMMFSKHEKVLNHFNNKASFPGRVDSSEDKHADIQGNTFAFGVILLEIISGRLPYCKDKGYLVDWAIKYLQQPEEIGKLVDPELTNVRTEDLAVICSVVSRCIDPDPSKRPSMQIITGVLENGIDLSAAAILKESSLAWAELALSL